MVEQVEKETETNQPINHNEKRLFSAKVLGHLFEYAKGQLISECPYEKSVLSKIPTKKFPRFLP